MRKRLVQKHLNPTACGVGAEPLQADFDIPGLRGYLVDRRLRARSPSHACAPSATALLAGRLPFKRVGGFGFGGGLVFGLDGFVAAVL